MKSLDGEGGEFNQGGMGIKPLLSQWPGPCVGSGLVDIKAEEMATHTAFANDMGELLTLILPIQKSEWGYLGHLAVRAVEVDMFLGRGISQCRELVAFFFFFCPIFFLHSLFFLMMSQFIYISFQLLSYLPHLCPQPPPYLCLHQPFFSFPTCLK